MKKLLSLLLVLSLCLSSMIILASCTGKSAYEIAVENGFVGDEKAWLESLKGPAGEAGAAGKDGKDGKDGADGLEGNEGDSAYEVGVENGFRGNLNAWFESLYGVNGANGHTPKVEVNENGYWVVDGQRLPYKVDGSNVALPTKIELVNSTFSVVKGDAALPTVELKVELDDGTTEIIPVAMTSLKDVDFTKEGEYPITLSYAGVTTEATIKVDGLMVYYQDFNTVSSANMADLLGDLGWKLTIAHPSNSKGWKGADENDIAPNLAAIEGVDLTPYAIIGGAHRPNYVGLSVQEGRLRVDNATYNPKSGFDAGIVVCSDEYMKNCTAGVYTIQYDYQLVDETEKAAMTDAGLKLGGAFSIAANMTIHSATTKSAKFAFIAPRVYAGGSMQPAIRFNSYKNIPKAWDSVDENGYYYVNLCTKLFPDESVTNIYGRNITFRIVITPKNEGATNDWGYAVYAKSATADKFELVCEFDQASAGAAWFGNPEVLTSSQFGFYCYNGTVGYLDNVAIWTGAGEMPFNTSTSLYEALITPAA